MREREDLPEGETDPTLADLIEGATRKFVTAVVIAGALIGLAIWSRPSSNHYQAVAADGRIYRINTRSGTVVGCEGNRCAIVMHRDQDLEDALEPPVPPRQLAPPQAAPAPAPPPAPAPQAAPAPAPANR